MDYKKHYDKLITRAKLLSRGRIDGYCEQHHILPRCIGGLDIVDNLVLLTPEEHYIAHLLLVKIYPFETGLIYAANMMANRNNKQYGWIKRKFSVQNSIDHTGMKHTLDAKKKMSEKGKNRPKTKEHKNNIRKAKLKTLEYKNEYYIGFNDLKQKTGISYHLYNKLYLNGIDPEPFIGNNTYAMIKAPKTTVKGKKWYNDGYKEKYGDVCPEGWKPGRLFKKRNSKGQKN